MSLVRALEMVLELAEANMLTEEYCDDACLKREAKKQEKAYLKVQELINILKKKV